MKLSRRLQDRLAKLLRLERGSTGHERERAREARLRLLKPFGLSPDDLEVRDRRVDPPLGHVWHLGLLAGAAQAHGFKWDRVFGEGSEHLIVRECDKSTLDQLQRWARQGRQVFDRDARGITRLFLVCFGLLPPQLVNDLPFSFI